MLRSILGVVVGILVAGVTVVVLETVGHLIFPPPGGMDPKDLESIKKHLPHLPLGALISVLVAWSVGTLLGSCLAAFIAQRRALVHAGIVGVVFLSICVASLAMIPHPPWFMVATVLLVPTATLAGGLLAARGTSNLNKAPEQAGEPNP